VDNTLYVFGGRMDQGRNRFTGENFYSNDLHAFDLRTRKWTQLRPDTSGSSPATAANHNLHILATQADVAHTYSPCGRRSHSAIGYNSKIIVFGGFQENIQKHFNDMHAYDVARNEWCIVEQQGLIPRARRRHSCNLVGSRMLIFGGTGPGEYPPPATQTAAGVRHDNSNNAPAVVDPSLRIQYDELLLRLQRNFTYVQNASRERNLLDLNELNHSLEVARARILAPLQQLLTMNEHLLVAVVNAPPPVNHNEDNNNNNNNNNRRLMEIEDAEEPMAIAGLEDDERAAVAGDDFENIIADLNSLNDRLVGFENEMANGGVVDFVNNEVAIIGDGGDDDDEDVNVNNNLDFALDDVDDDSGSDDMINDEGDNELDEAVDDALDEDFNFGLLSLSDLHVFELDGKNNDFFFLNRYFTVVDI
jgi:hypothetical protein